MDRPKRQITKPQRYQTTSSDEAPTVSGTTVPDRSIEEDMRDLRGIFKENSSQNIYENITHTPTHYIPPQRQDQYVQLQTPTHIQPYPSYTPPSTYIEHVSPTSVSNGNQVYVHTGTSVPRQFQDEGTGWYERRSTQGQEMPNDRNDAESRKIHDRFDRVEAELRKLNNTMERILRYSESNHSRRRALEKPVCLPISTETAMLDFESANEDTYERVVEYLEYIGGFNVKESVNLCFKEAIKDSLTTAFTWFGREEGQSRQSALYNKRIVRAIFDAVSNNRHFNTPSRTEFQMCMREALRAAKQRHRMAARGPRQREQHTARRFWNDEPDESLDEAVEAPNENN